MMPVKKSTKAKLEEGGGSVIGQKKLQYICDQFFNTNYDSPENGLLKEVFLHSKGRVPKKKTVFLMVFLRIKKFTPIFFWKLNL